MVFDILALVSLIAVLALLKRIVSIFPSLMACLVRWKENINLQLSLKTRTDRNLFAIALIIPFCLTAFRFRLYCPDFMDNLKEDTGIGITFGVFAAYIALRAACKYMFRLHKTSSSTYETANDSAWTYFIILSLLLMAAGSILTIAGVPLQHIRTAMFWISGAIYLIFIIRKTQIFLSSCSFLVSFLYLCALEILPTGVLIASAVIF